MSRSPRCGRRSCGNRSKSAIAVASHAAPRLPSWQRQPSPPPADGAHATWRTQRRPPTPTTRNAPRRSVGRLLQWCARVVVQRFAKLTRASYGAMNPQRSSQSQPRVPCASPTRITYRHRTLRRARADRRRAAKNRRHSCARRDVKCRDQPRGSAQRKPSAAGAPFTAP